MDRRRGQAVFEPPSNDAQASTPLAPIDLPADRELVVCVDTMVDGVHFDHRTSPHDLGYKALAVNLSDIAAMGAEALAYSAVLSAQADRRGGQWVEALSAGLSEIAAQFSLTWRGGIVIQGESAITVEVVGALASQALTRSAARAGDKLVVTGTLGDAGAALSEDLRAASAADRRFLLERLMRPSPRLALASAAARWCSAAIDLSDGLASDLVHVLEASAVAARVDLAKLPISHALGRVACAARASRYATSSGDDYELLLTCPPRSWPQFQSTAHAVGCEVTCIGEILPAGRARRVGSIEWTDAGGAAVAVPPGYQHFR